MKTVLIILCALTTTLATAQTDSTANKIAILPFGFNLVKDTATTQTAEATQQLAFAYLSQNAKVMQVQSIAITNAVLKQQGIQVSNLRYYAATHLGALLGVQYLVIGTVTENPYSSQSRSTFKNVTTTDASGNSYTNSVNTTSYSYQTTVTILIYNNTGKVIYQKDDTGFWNSTEGYQKAIEKLLKKSPLFKK